MIIRRRSREISLIWQRSIMVINNTQRLVPQTAVIVDVVDRGFVFSLPKSEASYLSREMLHAILNSQVRCVVNTSLVVRNASFIFCLASLIARKVFLLSAGFVIQDVSHRRY